MGSTGRPKKDISYDSQADWTLRFYKRDTSTLNLAGTPTNNESKHLKLLIIYYKMLEEPLKDSYLTRNLFVIKTSVK